ncbi:MULTISPECIES: cell division protein ZapA [unclassified Moraxella]|uniref:cell division protein ZapA n=1 Tax=unclassified Moraxella TaxID=2685852 RepID=UPI003AF90F28
MTSNTMSKVDIFINGRSYTINCPSNEEPALQRASNYIQNFVQDMRRHAPQLPQEELLVLCALTLYEKSEQLEALQAQTQEASDKVNTMLQRVADIAHG